MSVLERAFWVAIVLLLALALALLIVGGDPCESDEHLLTIGGKVPICVKR